MVRDSRGIIDALVRGGTAERIGLIESPWAETIAEWVKQGYPTRLEHLEAGEKRWCAEDGRRTPIDAPGDYEAPVPAEEHFGFDIAACGGFFELMPHPGMDELLEETEEWEIRRNGAGAAFKYWKHKSGTPEHIDFLMTTREVWERDYRPHLLAADPARLKEAKPILAWKARAESATAWKAYGELFVWELARASMGDIALYEALLLDPGWIRDYCRVYTDFFKAHFAMTFQRLGKPDGVWIFEDLGFKTGLFASPAVLRELIFPFYRELVEFFHQQDLPVLLHSCGSIAEALPLIVEAGFDALNPMERKAEGNDPFAFAERYGDRLAFIGGFDARIFETNDSDLIRREVVRYLEGMKARGARLVFGSDHSLSPRVRYDTYRRALDVYREHMRY